MNQKVMRQEPAIIERRSGVDPGRQIKEENHAQIPIENLQERQRVCRH